jgi:hypothetical protein
LVPSTTPPFDLRLQCIQFKSEAFSERNHFIELRMFHLQLPYIFIYGVKSHFPLASGRQSVQVHPSALLGHLTACDADRQFRENKLNRSLLTRLF